MKMYKNRSIYASYKRLYWAQRGARGAPGERPGSTGLGERGHSRAAAWNSGTWSLAASHQSLKVQSSTKPSSAFDPSFRVCGSQRAGAGPGVHLRLGQDRVSCGHLGLGIKDNVCSVFTFRSCEFETTLRTLSAVSAPIKDKHSKNCNKRNL